MAEGAWHLEPWPLRCIQVRSRQSGPLPHARSRGCRQHAVWKQGAHIVVSQHCEQHEEHRASVLAAWLPTGCCQPQKELYSIAWLPAGACVHYARYMTDDNATGKETCLFPSTFRWADVCEALMLWQRPVHRRDTGDISIAVRL
jgi:hypothetical protein